MKRPILCLILFLLTAGVLRAQTVHQVRGIVQDTTGVTLPGTSVRLVSATDTLATSVNTDGTFVFPTVKASEFRLTVSLIGFLPVNRRIIEDPSKANINVGIIKLKVEFNQLKGVTIVGVNPVTIKEDTVDYKISAYKVREGAPVEDAIRKMPGTEIDKDGNITNQGKAVQRIRVNGKDYFGGDVKTATQNLPADVIESAQFIDDYGDQANLTGVKSGEPDKILNLVIRKDKNKGYFGNATVGDGRDALPSPATNANRFLATLNANIYDNDRQISVVGNINNTNINTFTFSGNGSGQGNRGGGGGGGFGTSGGGGGGFSGGGRQNAARVGGGGGGTTTPTNGININRSIGLNYRDEWGKKVTVYGSYSFSDRTTNTISTNVQSNSASDGTIASESNQFSNGNDDNVNHRFNFNLEYRPDTVNYIKVTPTFSYSDVTNFSNEDFSTSYQRTTSKNIYNSITNSNNTSPNYGVSVLLNHRFQKRGRNFSLQGNLNKSTSNQDQVVDYTYLQSFGRISPDQNINVDNTTRTSNINLSYLEPVSKHGYLELNYTYNHSYTQNTRLTDTLNTTSDGFDRSSILSNDFNYTFTTNRVGLNYRFIETKYNYTLGFGVQPNLLEGVSPSRNVTIHNSTFNYVPTARLIYNFSRSQALTFNYSGNSNQPNFSQLQPVADLSNAQYPVEGNPNLNPEFNNNISLRYNKFSFTTGDVLLANVSYNQTSNKIVTNTINNPGGIYGSNSILTRYLNADGYYTANAFFVYSKPFSARKYTVSYNGNLNYANNVGYINDVENVGKNWAVTNGVRFRVNITDIMETELNTNYTFNNTDYTLASSSNLNAHIKTTNIGLNGKNYFWKNWTLGYDLIKTINQGYTANTNPFIINTYVERRFLKQNRATIRLSGFDLLKQNIGQSISSSSSSYTQTTTNRLSRYVLLSFNLRLQKFAGKAPEQQNDFRRDGGGGSPGGGGGRPPGGGGPPME